MTTFKIATWNVNSINVRLNHLLEFLAEHDPDVICLQELKCETEKFPYEAFDGLPYNLYVHGEKSYNGVAILSKIPADEVKTRFADNLELNQARFIEIALDTPIGYSKIISLYVPNGGEVNSDKFIAKLEFYDAFTDYVSATQKVDEKLFIGSDFNVAPFDIDVHSPDHLRNATCFTHTEQKKLRTLLNLYMVDNYRVIHPDKKEFTWWDYRAGAFEQNKGMRIDTILSSPGATRYISQAYIDYKSREKHKPSDHAPVIICYEID